VRISSYRSRDGLGKQGTGATRTTAQVRDEIAWSLFVVAGGSALKERDSNTSEW
jgi:hypothetical protein